MFTKKVTPQRVLKYVLFFTLFFMLIVKIAPVAIDFILDKIEQENEWRRARLEKYYGQEIEEFRRQQEENVSVYYDIDGKCLKNCHLEK
jgi:hypothetical protein